LISIPAAVGDSRADALFHKVVAAHDTSTPSTTEPSTSASTARVPAPPGASRCPVTAASGNTTSVMAPVARPTTVAQPPCGTSGLRVKKVALARPYHVQRATAATVTSTPRAVVSTDACRAAEAPAIASTFTMPSPAATRAIGAASERHR
jgi:hypothetical protein